MIVITKIGLLFVITNLKLVSFDGMICNQSIVSRAVMAV